MAGAVRLLPLAVLCCLLAAVQAFVPPTSLQVQRQCRSQSQLPVAMTAATKATRTNRRRYEYNKMYKSEMRTRIKTVEVAVKSGDYADASKSLSKAMSIIDKNVKRNIVHKNTAARKKSQLTLKVKALEPSPAAEVAPPAVE